jgi:hypothetical protein
VTKAGAGAAAVFGEVIQAKQTAAGGTRVRALFASLAALAAATHQLAAKLEHGRLDRAGIEGVNGQVVSIERDAAAAGVPIKEHAPRSLPGPGFAGLTA